MFNKENSQKILFSFILLLIASEVLFLISVFTPVGSYFRNNLAAILPSVLVLSTNKERTSQDLSELKENELLVKAAQIKADDMAAREFFSHVNPDGQKPWGLTEGTGNVYKTTRWKINNLNCEGSEDFPVIP